MKTCVTCIFKSGGLCTAQWQIAPRIDPVTGVKISGTHYHCSTQRSHEYNSCGENGKWWAEIRAPKATTKQGAPNEYPTASIFGKAILSVLSLFRN